MLLAAGGDVGVELALLTGLDDGRAAVAGIRDQSLGSLACVGLDPLDHRQQVHDITGLDAHADSHDHLVVAIDGRQAVLALNLDTIALHDVAVEIGETHMGLMRWEASAAGHGILAAFTEAQGGIGNALSKDLHAALD
jgi:hypothetical protein